MLKYSIMFEETTLLKGAIIILATAGFFLANYIRAHRVKEKPLVCPIGTSCKDVIDSKYAKLFGVHVERWGMLYYGIIAVSYIIFLLAPVYATQSYLVMTFALTIIAFIFSIYLTLIQAFSLKQWCTWCIISAILCTLIFFCTLTLFNTLGSIV